MKFKILIYLIISIGFGAHSQITFKAYFYPDTIKVNNKTLNIDTTSFEIKDNGETRLILWENQENKVSMSFKVRNTEKKIKVKSRVEIFRKGRWEKEKMKVKMFHEAHLIKVYKWSSNFVMFHTEGVKPESGADIRETFIGDNGELILVVGYFKVFWVLNSD